MSDTSNTDGLVDQSNGFLTIMIAEETFGIPILQVQDVLREQHITQIPLAPPGIAGSLNLRGRIVTAINARALLGIAAKTDDEDQSEMSVVLEHENELYSLIIDSVGDVINLQEEFFEPTPATLDPTWRNIASGVYRQDDRLLIILDVPKFLDSMHNKKTENA